MSQGGGASVKAEPELVPLLDLVFQLIMFFMICVNFVSDQVNEEIQLPIAQSARPMDSTLSDVVVLNMDARGTVSSLGADKLATPGAKRVFLRQYYADAKRAAEDRGDRKGTVKTTIIVRAHKDATYNQVYELLGICKEVGFHRLQLRANVKS
jgi:biopolymer transport protein ExbD